ncbi:MAG: hypothetical protein AAB431_02220 [Patescibacteria group bacterium]
MKLHHRHSFFPLILALLTIALLAFMFFTFTNREGNAPIREDVVAPVSEPDYQKNLQTLTKKFIDGYTQTEDQAKRLTLAEQTLSSLLTMRVPASFKDLHLELAVQMNQLKENLQPGAAGAKESFDQFVRTTKTQSWLE